MGQPFNINEPTRLGNLKDSAFFSEKVSAFSGVFPSQTGKKRKLFQEKNRNLLSFKVSRPKNGQEGS